MKKLPLFFAMSLLTAGLTLNLNAQGDKSNRPSPPRSASGQAGDIKITIDYGAPSVKGRTVYGNLVPYNKVWRTGANEATTFSIDKDAKINGKTLAAGKYSLFTIPGKEEWTVIFNKNPNQWGAYDYDEKEDALRIQVKPKKTSNLQEQLSFNVDNGKVQFAWEHQSFDFTVSSK
jgi:hypothetical protein